MRSVLGRQDPTHTPLLRLAWNKQDPNYLATVAMDACEVIILDVRVPCTPVARLNNHRACVNGIAWAPHSSCHICTAGDDHQVTLSIFMSQGAVRCPAWCALNVRALLGHGTRTRTGWACSSSLNCGKKLIDDTFSQNFRHD